MRPLALLLALAWGSGAVAQDLAYRLPTEMGTLASPLAPEAGGLAPQVADEWLGRDKAYHAGASFGLAVGSYVVLTEGLGAEADAARPLAAGAALAIGLAKEYADERRKRHPLFSWKDLVADAAGVALAIAVTTL